MITRRETLLGMLESGFFASSSLAQAPSRATRLIAAARKQIGITLTYDPAYSRLAFPNGDVPRSKGVCTDVVIRAYRDAFGIDLQSLVNADMTDNFSAYPKRWGLRSTDRNIDHRRVPNLQTFLTRNAAKQAGSEWRAGEIATWMVNGSLPHIGIISDRRTRAGHPLVIHNIGQGTREEDVLFAFPVTGHYCWRIDS